MPPGKRVLFALTLLFSALVIVSCLPGPTFTNTTIRVITQLAKTTITYILPDTWPISKAQAIAIAAAQLPAEISGRASVNVGSPLIPSYYANLTISSDSNGPSWLVEFSNMSVTLEQLNAWGWKEQYPAGEIQMGGGPYITLHFIVSALNGAIISKTALSTPPVFTSSQT